VCCGGRRSGRGHRAHDAHRGRRSRPLEGTTAASDGLRGIGPHIRCSGRTHATPAVPTPPPPRPCPRRTSGASGGPTGRRPGRPRPCGRPGQAHHSTGPDAVPQPLQFATISSRGSSASGDSGVGVPHRIPPFELIQHLALLLGLGEVVRQIEFADALVVDEVMGADRGAGMLGHGGILGAFADVRTLADGLRTQIDDLQSGLPEAGTRRAAVTPRSPRGRRASLREQ